MNNKIRKELNKAIDILETVKDIKDPEAAADECIKARNIVDIQCISEEFSYNMLTPSLRKTAMGIKMDEGLYDMEEASELLVDLTDECNYRAIIGGYDYKNIHPQIVKVVKLIKRTIER